MSMLTSGASGRGGECREGERLFAPIKNGEVPEGRYVIPFPILLLELIKWGISLKSPFRCATIVAVRWC